MVIQAILHIVDISIQHIDSKITITGLTALVSSLTALLATLYGNLKHMWKYLYDKNDETHVAEIVKAVQANDLKNKQSEVELMQFQEQHRSSNGDSIPCENSVHDRLDVLKTNIHGAKTVVVTKMANTTATAKTTKTANTANTAKTVKTTETVKTAKTTETTNTPDTPDTPDTLDTIDTIDTPDTSKAGKTAYTQITTTDADAPIPS